MKITPCPICGRNPSIKECCTIKKYKNGIRRRMCGCNNYCSIIPYTDHLYRSCFIFEGEGDDNAIYNEWNKAIEIYKYDKSLNYYVDWKKWKSYTSE